MADNPTSGPIVEAISSDDASKKLDALLFTTGKVVEKVDQLDHRTDRIEEALVALTRVEERVQRFAEDLNTTRASTSSGQEELWQEIRSIREDFNEHDKVSQSVIGYVNVMREKDGIEAIDFVKDLKKRDPLPLLDKLKTLFARIDKVALAVILFFIVGILGVLVNFKSIISPPPTAPAIQQEQVDEAMQKALKELIMKSTLSDDSPFANPGGS